MITSLSATSAPTVRSRTRLPCATITRSPGPAPSPSTATTRRAVSPPPARPGPPRSRLRPVRPPACRDAQSRPTTRPSSISDPASDLLALALGGLARALLGDRSRLDRWLGNRLDGSPRLLRLGRRRRARLRPLDDRQHVEQSCVGELAQLGDVVLVLATLQLVGGGRHQLVVTAHLFRPRGDRMEPDQLAVADAQQALAQVILALIARVENADDLVDQLVFPTELVFDP